MKRIFLILGGILLISIYSFGQSDRTYRDRNHKLNPDYAKGMKKSSTIVPMKKDIRADVYSYLARNQKMRLTTLEATLVMVKSPKDFHYRAMNHKLNPNFRHGAPLTDDTAVANR